MAYTRIVHGRAHGPHNYMEFVCDTESEVPNLPNLEKYGISGANKFEPCCAGSIAIIVEGKVKKMLTNANEWVTICSVGSSGSVGGIGVTSDGDGNVTII